MYNQRPIIGRINPSFTLGEQHPPQKPMGQPVAPQRVYLNFSGYPTQPYGAPGGPQGQYAQQQPYPGMSVYPQGPGQTGVTVQPTVFMTSTPAIVNMPDYLCYSIFTLLCCCFPLGIAAVMFSAPTRDANMAGRQDLAIRSSRTALVLNNVALLFGLAIYTAVTVVLLFAYGVIK